MVTRACFDTNILIDYLSQVQDAHDLFSRYDELVISNMVYMEVMVGIDPRDLNAMKEVVSMMAMFEIVGIDDVAELAIWVRRDTNIKFPDAIIHATALSENIPLLTRNQQDFRPVSFRSNIEIRIPYVL